MLENIFIIILNMSIIASVVAALIIFFRWIFKDRLPRIFSYALWAIVLVRLLIPFTVPSTVSIFNAIPLTETVVTQSGQYHNPKGYNLDDTSYEELEEKIGNESKTSVNKSSYSATSLDEAETQNQELTKVLSLIWAIGVVGLISFSVFAYIRISHGFKEAVLYKNNNLITECSKKLKLKRKVKMYTSDKVNTPVVCGLIRVRIILPTKLIQGCDEIELKHIITHELVHIKRFDYILKPLSMLALCLHWFNPVIWLGFILSQKDMEMSCDEKVMSVFDNDIRKEYASSLIKLATEQKVLLNNGLLAFGESNIKSRIKGIMSFRKRGVWLSLITIIILLTIGALLLTNGQLDTTNTEGVDEGQDKLEQITGFAWEFINRDIDNYESNPDVSITNSKITRLELIESFDSLADSLIEVYALEYRLLPKDLNKIVMAGGMDVDEDGWLKETTSMGSPLLVILHEEDSLRLLGTIWTGGVLEEGGMKPSLERLLEQNNVKINYDEPFDKSLVEEFFLETAVINASEAKDGPAEGYNTIRSLEYGEIVIAIGRYRDWFLCKQADGDQEFWVHSSNLIDVQQHRDYNLGVITADEVTVGAVTLNKGNLIQVLKVDGDRSCVTIRVIDINVGITGWIDNGDYTQETEGVYFNQAFLRPGTAIYKEPSLSEGYINDFEPRHYELFINIVGEQDGWAKISTFGPIDGWVQKENIYIPKATN